ncbi:YkuD_like domain containing protein [Rhabdaerophilaceae bacterium]
MRAALILAGCFLASLAAAQPAALPQPPPAALGTPPPVDVPVAPKAKPVVKAKPKPVAPVAHTRVVAKDDPRPTIYPGAADAIQDAAERYRQIAESGGWPTLPAGLSLKAGQTGDAVITLRHRLIREGDLDPELGDNPVFDPALVRAVKLFQARHGQTQNGLVAGATLKALRVSAQERYQALNESARRLAQRQFGFGPRYVVVNIPSASVEAIAAGQVERRHIAVVGKADRPSPEVETRITNVNFNPTWTVPVSIIKKDIIPKMQKDPGYLAKSKIRIFGASGAEIDPARIDWNTERATAFTLRQDPGSGNSLGQIRIDMPNRDAVYMHDTPSKRLFLRDDRFHSSGCVRVENVRDFVSWLLKPTPGPGGGWDRQDIDDILKTDTRKDVRLKDYVPVIWAYLTGYVTPDGQVHFRDDVYGLDQVAILSMMPDETPTSALGTPRPASPNDASQPLPRRTSATLAQPPARPKAMRPDGPPQQRLDP